MGDRDNLDIANMDWEEFADAAGDDGMLEAAQQRDTQPETELEGV